MTDPTDLKQILARLDELDKVARHRFGTMHSQEVALWAIVAEIRPALEAWVAVEEHKIDIHCDSFPADKNNPWEAALDVGEFSEARFFHGPTPLAAVLAAMAKGEEDEPEDMKRFVSLYDPRTNAPHAKGADDATD